MANDLKSLRARNGEGGPQIQGLRETKDIRSTVSSQGLYMYDEKRPDFIQYMGGGQNWERLSSALRGLNPQLNAYLFKQGEDLRQRNTALGQELMHRNKTDWATFIKTHPEYAGLNPHLERGYKSAELMTKAQDYQAAQQDFYTTSGLVNETDTEKVRAALSEFGQKWIQENVSPEALGYAYDPELYAENFLRPAQAAEGAIMNRHSGDRANENLKLVADNYSRLIGSSAETLFRNTPNLSDPDVFSGAVKQFSNYVMGLQNEMLANGVPMSMANGIVEDAIIALAKGEGEEGFGDELLGIADQIQTGTGTLGGRPEFKAKKKALEEEWKHDRRQRNAEYIQMYRFNREKSHDEALKIVGTAMSNAYQSGEPQPDITALIALPGVGIDNLPAAVSAQNMFQASATYKPIMDKANQIDYVMDEGLARRGELTQEYILGSTVKYGPDKARQLADMNEKALLGADPVSLVLRSPQAEEGRQNISVSMTEAMGGKNEFKIAQAQRRYDDEMEAEALDRKKRGVSFSAAELRIVSTRIEREIMSDPSTTALKFGSGIMLTGEEQKAIKTPEFWASNKLSLFGASSGEDLKEAQLKIKNAIIERYNNPGSIPDELIQLGLPNNLIDAALYNQASLHDLSAPAIIELEKKRIEYNKQQKDNALRYSPLLPRILWNFVPDTNVTFGQKNNNKGR